MRNSGGVGFDYDPQWLLTPAQKELQARIIELSRTTLRKNAVDFKHSISS